MKGVIATTTTNSRVCDGDGIEIGFIQLMWPVMPNNCPDGDSTFWPQATDITTR